MAQVHCIKIQHRLGEAGISLIRSTMALVRAVMQLVRLRGGAPFAACMHEEKRISLRARRPVDG